MVKTVKMKNKIKISILFALLISITSLFAFNFTNETNITQNIKVVNITNSTVVV